VISKQELGLILVHISPKILFCSFNDFKFLLMSEHIF